MRGLLVATGMVLVASSASAQQPRPAEANVRGALDRIARIDPVLASIHGRVTPGRFSQRHLKLLINVSVIKCQPSTSTNKSNLNGSEMSTGGSIIMPMLMRIDEITMSMIRNGK